MILVLRRKQLDLGKPECGEVCDMIGNVWEWCSDWYEDYPTGNVTDPKSPSSGSSRVVRGCSLGHGAGSVRLANRFRFDPGSRNDIRDIRPILSLGE